MEATLKQSTFSGNDPLIAFPVLIVSGRNAAIAPLNISI
jgi:hypothetical protein